MRQYGSVDGLASVAGSNAEGAEGQIPGRVITRREIILSNRLCEVEEHDDGWITD